MSFEKANKILNHPQVSKAISTLDLARLMSGGELEHVGNWLAEGYSVGIHGDPNVPYAITLTGKPEVYYKLGRAYER